MSHLVAPDVAKRIRAAAAALGYQPNVTAAGLRTGRSGLIGVLAPDIADPGFPPVLSGITETLGAEGYATIVVDVGPDRSRQQELVDKLIARGVDGLVLATVTLNDPVVGHCIAASIPVVLVNRTDAGRRLPAVVTDDEAGMRLAVEHLVALGHRRIGHIAGPQHVSTGALRRAGFKAAAAKAGLPAQNIMIETARAYTARGRDGWRRCACSIASRADRDRRRQRPAGARHLRCACRARIALPVRRLGGRPQRHALCRYAVAAADHRAHRAAETWATRPRACCSTRSPTPPRAASAWCWSPV